MGALAVTIISIGTFPGEVTALTLDQASPSPNDATSPSMASPQERDVLLRRPLGLGLSADPNTCPNFTQQEFKNPPFVSSKYGELDITLTAAPGTIRFGEQSFQGLGLRTHRCN
jgi:hypothetical protein